MASVSRDPNGNFTVQFVGGDKKRRSVRLGKVSQKTAESIKLRVEALNAVAIAKLPMDADLARWVAGIGDGLHAKLAKVGLIPERPKAVTLGELVERYTAETAGAVKPGTRVTHRVMTADLLRFLTPAADPRAVTAAAAAWFLAHLREQGLASATVARRLRRARSVFAFAVRVKLIPDNPFAGLTAPSHLPESRKAYVPPSDAAKLLAAATPAWRAIVALCLYCGLRCPSEVLSLKWEHVDFAGRRMSVSSPKTENTPGKAYRVCPLFADLRPYIDEAWELAEPGEVYVVGGEQGATYRAAADTPKGWANCNLRTQFLKVVRRAGLTPWPRIFHALRASCETGLLERFPISAVTEWLGHSATVALKHYARVPDHLFDRAAWGGAESGAVRSGLGRTGADSRGAGPRDFSEGLS